MKAMMPMKDKKDEVESNESRGKMKASVRLVSVLSFFVSGLVSLLIHCVRLVSLLSPFSSLLVGHSAGLVSLLSPSVSLVVGHSPNSLLLGVLSSFLRCVRPFCHCWCLPSFRWPCSISHCWCPPFCAGHAARTAGVRPFPLAMQHFCSFVSKLLSFLFYSYFFTIFFRFGACAAGVRPFPLAMQRFYSFFFHVMSFRLPGSVPALLVSALFRWPCSISLHLSPM